MTSGLNDQDARALTYLAVRIRAETYGAGPWDENGTFTNIRKLTGRSLALATESVIAHAADPKAKTPGVILGAYTPDKPSSRPKDRAHPPRKSEECRKHPGQYATNCGGCAADARAVVYDDEPPPGHMDREHALAAARAALMAGRHVKEEEVMSELLNKDVPMFEVDTPPVVVPKRPAGTGKPRWTRYKLKTPVKCDDCMLILAISEGRGPVARYALFRRVQDGRDLLLCVAHAQERRDEDGMRKLKP